MSYVGELHLLEKKKKKKEKERKHFIGDQREMAFRGFQQRKDRPSSLLLNIREGFPSKGGGLVTPSKRASFRSGKILRKGGEGRKIPAADARGISRQRNAGRTGGGGTNC